MKQPVVADVRHVSMSDHALVGTKAAYLGASHKLGLKVPAGFVVTAAAFREFLTTAKLTGKIERLLRAAKNPVAKDLHRLAREIRSLILQTPLSPRLQSTLEENYRSLVAVDRSAGRAVAVRPSPDTSALTDASFVGQQETFFHIMGSDAVIRSVKELWASLYAARPLKYRLQHGLTGHDLPYGVLVQQMIEPDRSGVLFTTNPVSNNPDELVIEAIYGLGEALVRGQLSPDRYVVSKTDGTILEAKTMPQPWRLVSVGGKTSGKTAHRLITKPEQRRPKLLPKEVVALAELGKQLEQARTEPYALEWALDETGQVWILEALPLVAKPAKPVARQSAAPMDQPVLAHGLGAALGWVTGPVRIIHKTSQLKDIRAGEIIVAELTNPSFLPLLEKAAALVIDTGGVTSHTAMLAREMGMPCVVGTGSASHQLTTGMIVTVDGYHGLVYKGKVASDITPQSPDIDVPITATKVVVNLANAQEAERISQLSVDGVGLLRAEFMFANIGVHPRYLLEERKEQVFIRKLTDGLRTIAQSFGTRPVLYRASDLKTNEYRSLEGGAKVEAKETNPALGYRGAFRYTREPDLFNLELQALKTARDSYGLKNLSLMIPFVRTVEEFMAVRAQVEQTGLLAEPTFKLWMMVEVPANLFQLEGYIQAGVDGISIGTNDLTQLLLGVDRDNPRLANVFDERHPVVLEAVRHIIHTARRHHLPVSVCGHAASVYPELVETAVRAGVTSLSVDPDAILTTRRLVASVERRILLEALTATAHGSH